MAYASSYPNYANINPVAAGSASAAVGGQIFGQNIGRSQLYIQVVGSGGPLYVSLSASPATTGNFHVALKPAAATFGGDGGVLSLQGFVGPVNVSGSVECRYVAWENRGM